MAGSAANGINFLLDGGDNNDAFSNVNLPIPFPDAVQEFNVQTSGLPAAIRIAPRRHGQHRDQVGQPTPSTAIFSSFLRNGDLNGAPKGEAVSQPLRDS